MIFFYICVLDIPLSEGRKRTAYQQKITEYMDRAEKLKDLIQQEKGRRDYFPFREVAKGIFHAAHSILLYLCLISV